MLTYIGTCIHPYMDSSKDQRLAGMLVRIQGSLVNHYRNNDAISLASAGATCRQQHNTLMIVCTRQLGYSLPSLPNASETQYRNTHSRCTPKSNSQITTHSIRPYKPTCMHTHSHNSCIHARLFHAYSQIPKVHTKTSAGPPSQSTKHCVYVLHTYGIHSYYFSILYVEEIARAVLVVLLVHNVRFVLCLQDFSSSRRAECPILGFSHFGILELQGADGCLQQQHRPANGCN